MPGIRTTIDPNNLLPQGRAQVYLVEACIEGDLYGVLKQLATGLIEDVEFEDYHERQALAECVMTPGKTAERLKIVQILLTLGANPSLYTSGNAYSARVDTLAEHSDIAAIYPPEEHYEQGKVYSPPEDIVRLMEMSADELSAFFERPVVKPISLSKSPRNSSASVSPTNSLLPSKSTQSIPSADTSPLPSPVSKPPSPVENLSAASATNGSSQTYVSRDPRNPRSRASASTFKEASPQAQPVPPASQLPALPIPPREPRSTRTSRYDEDVDMSEGRNEPPRASTSTLPPMPSQPQGDRLRPSTSRDSEARHGGRSRDRSIEYEGQRSRSRSPQRRSSPHQRGDRGNSDAGHSSRDQDRSAANGDSDRRSSRQPEDLRSSTASRRVSQRENNRSSVEMTSPARSGDRSRPKDIPRPVTVKDEPVGNFWKDDNLITRYKERFGLNTDNGRDRFYKGVHIEELRKLHAGFKTDYTAPSRQFTHFRNLGTALQAIVFTFVGVKGHEPLFEPMCEVLYQKVKERGAIAAWELVKSVYYADNVDEFCSAMVFYFAKVPRVNDVVIPMPPAPTFVLSQNAAPGIQSRLLAPTQTPVVADPPAPDDGVRLPEPQWPYRYIWQVENTLYHVPKDRPWNYMAVMCPKAFKPGGCTRGKKTSRTTACSFAHSTELQVAHARRVKEYPTAPALWAEPLTDAERPAPGAASERQASAVPTTVNENRVRNESVRPTHRAGSAATPMNVDDFEPSSYSSARPSTTRMRVPDGDLPSVYSGLDLEMQDSEALLLNTSSTGLNHTLSLEMPLRMLLASEAKTALDAKEWFSDDPEVLKRYKSYLHDCAGKTGQEDHLVWLRKALYYFRLHHTEVMRFSAAALSASELTAAERKERNGRPAVNGYH